MTSSSWAFFSILRVRDCHTTSVRDHLPHPLPTPVDQDMLHHRGRSDSLLSAPILRPCCLSLSNSQTGCLRWSPMVLLYTLMSSRYNRRKCSSASRKIIRISLWNVPGVLQSPKDILLYLYLYMPITVVNAVLWWSSAFTCSGLYAYARPLSFVAV